jgi:hypothetical protein
VPPVPGERKDTRTGGALSRASSSRGRELRPASEAWAKIAAPLDAKLGGRVLFFGITGSGKTTGVKNYLAYVVGRNLVDVVLIHDVKKPEPQYEGLVIHDAREIYSAPPETFPAVRVLRRRNLDHMPSVETAARVTMECGYQEIPTLLVVDELQRGLTDGGKFASPSLRRIFCEGYGLHASVIGTKQLPQNVPTEATGQSAKVYFKGTAEGLNFLLDERKVTREHADAIAGLSVGEFTLAPEEGDFDGVIYQVPAP